MLAGGFKPLSSARKVDRIDRTTLSQPYYNLQRTKKSAETVTVGLKPEIEFHPETDEKFNILP